MKNKNEARAHHYVPQCWLAGFTESCNPDGLLYVTDLKRKKQWRCKPSEAGHRRDFYRIDDGSLNDPLAVEATFSKIESEIAPIFQALMTEKRGPKNEYELSMLIEYMAIQWIRVPTFRVIIGRNVYSHFKEEVLSSPDAWQQTKQRLGMPDDPETDYKRVLAAWESGDIVFSGQPAFYLKEGLQLIEEIDRLLKEYKWGWHISSSGQFVGFDSPVAMDGPAGRAVGFQSAGIVTYPVNRYLLLYGTREEIEPPFLNTVLIARHNAFAMRSADEQVYSHRPDFHWLDREGRCKNDWLLFSAADY